MQSSHEALVREATERLKSKGITKISYEATLPNRTRVDILALNKDDRKIAVECMVQVQPKWVIRKIRAYRPHVDKLIFLAPPSEVHKLKTISGIDEIWESKVVIINVYPLKLTEESLEGLVKITKKLGCSKADAIRDAIKHYAEYLEGLEVVKLRNVSVDEAKREILEHLKGRDRVSADEISDDLRIDMSLVNKVLLLLWQEGVVEPIE